MNGDEAYSSGADSGDDDGRSDSDLVEAANRGDVDAFEVLYRRHRDWVMRLAWRHTRDRDICLEVLQETFTYLMGKLPDLHLSARMRTFLYPVVRNLSIRIQKRRRRSTSGDVRADEMPAPEPEDPPRQRLAEALSNLGDGQREVVLMRFVDDMKLAQIAEALDIPLGTVKSRLHNALKKLRADERTRHYFESN